MRKYDEFEIECDLLTLLVEVDRDRDVVKVRLVNVGVYQDITRAFDDMGLLGLKDRVLKKKQEQEAET